MDQEDIVRMSLIKDINHKDPQLISKVTNIMTVPTQDLKAIRDIVNSPIIDDSPRKLVFKSGGVHSDYIEELVCNFSDRIEDEDEVIGELYLDDAKRIVDISVKRAFKAILETGITKDENVALAVQEITRQVIMMLVDHDNVTAKQFCDLIKPKSPVAKKIMAKVKELICD